MQEVKKLIKLDERPLPYITQWRLLGSAMQYEGTETKRYQAIRDLVISLQHGVFIVTAFQTIASELLLMLSHEGIQSSLISGKVSLTKRDEILKNLSTQPNPILIGVNQAVREGLNIPFIQNLIWLDTTWNNPSESQIRDRIRRITSHYESINEFYLTSQNSPEPWMLNIRTRKQKETNNLTVQGGY
jgi:superfamily II DNA/RNA helicase